MMRLQTELFTPAEVLAVEPRLHSHLLPILDCVICGQKLQQREQSSHASGGRVAYLAVIVNHSIGMATLAAVCERCSEGCPREELEVVVESTMRLALAPPRGHA